MFDKLFSPQSTTPISGVIERVGSLMVADTFGVRINGYAVLLQGNPQAFHVIPKGHGGGPFPSKPDLAIALGQPGDLVAFEYNDQHRVQLESFSNSSQN